MAPAETKGANRKAAITKEITVIVGIMAYLLVKKLVLDCACLMHTRMVHLLAELDLHMAGLV